MSDVSNDIPASTDKVAIVTGATSGMGIDIAKHLHARGWKVALIGRNTTAGKMVQDDIGGDNARFFQADVAHYQSQADMFRAVWNTWGRIDLLCANAGIVDKGSLYNLTRKNATVEDVPPEPDLTTTDINYKGVIHGVTLATHYMRHNQPTAGGKIVVNSSIGAIFPHRAFPEYCGTKAAVVQFVRGVAPLLQAKENIYINTVLPGIVATPIMPPEMFAAVSPDCITSVSTVIRAHDLFIDDKSGLAGQAVEASVDQVVWYHLPDYGNGHKTKRAVTVWEPLFRAFHGEDSGLPDAIA